MSQDELNRSVARATGESVNTIRHLGFSELRLPKPVYLRPTTNANRVKPAAKVPFRIFRAIAA